MNTEWITCQDYTTVEVTTLPKCVSCDKLAYADARVPSVGSWGYLCKLHFEINECSLGLGRGQRLVLST